MSRFDPTVVPVVGLCSVHMWSVQSQEPPNDEFWRAPTEFDETDSCAAWAYGRGDAERMMAVGVMLIMVPLVSSRAPKC